MFLILPFPPSQNTLFKNIPGGRAKTTRYLDWDGEAYYQWLEQKKTCGSPIKGKFIYHIVLDENKRANRDGDNFNKAVLDFLQRVGMIENDSLADAGSWSWGPTDPGMCTVSVYQKGLQPA